MQPSSFVELLEQDDLQPAVIASLKWLVSSPRHSEVVFDEQGMPLRVPTVDPRAFLLHKWYASRRDERSPAKRIRDEAHARVVAAVLANDLRHLPPAGSIRRLFPNSVVDNVADDTDEFSL